MVVVRQYGRRLSIRAAFFFFVLVVLCAAQDDPAELSRQGKELMAQSRFDEAANIYRALVQKIPGNPGLLLNLGLAEEMGGHPDKAVPHFEAVLRTQPDSIPALTSLAMARLQLQEPTQAIPMLKKLAALTPDDPNTRGMLAGAELSTGHTKQAAAQYRTLTKLSADDPKAWYGLGKAYEDLAASQFRRLTTVAPESGYLAVLLGDSRLQRQQYRSAFFFYREAEKKTPALRGIHSGLAHVYESTGHRDWSDIEQALETKLPSTDCQVQPGECDFLKGNLLGAAERSSTRSTASSIFWSTRAYNQLAIQAFDRLGQLPESIELHALKAQILHDHGQEREAAKEWRAALALSSTDDQARLRTELARSLFLAHDDSAAISELQDLLKLDPSSAELNFMTGETLRRTQQAEKALPLLHRAVQRQPDMLPAQASLGMTLASLGQSKEAIDHLEKAVSLDDDGSLHYSLARAYQAAGDREHARENMETYTKIQNHNHEINGNLAREAEITGPGAGGS